MKYRHTNDKSKWMSNAEIDDAIENDWENIKDYLPCLTSTMISYKAGSTEALIWNIGDKKKTKIKLPLEDGWYLANNKWKIPNGAETDKWKILNGAETDSSNPDARFLCRCQDGDFRGLLWRGYGFNDDVRRHVVFLYDPPSIRFGVEKINQN
jgi:hypothetical protein